MKNVNTLVEHLQKITNKKIILVENDDFDIDKVDIDTSGVFVPKRLEGRKEQLLKEKLRELNITKIYPDGSVDVDGDVDLRDLELIKIPIKFNKVSGSFYCLSNQLTSLRDCPKYVGKSFWCNDNKLISLEGGPEEVGGDFICFNNKLTNLVGSPRKINRDFMCSNNQLTSLEGCPKEVLWDFWISSNPKKFTKKEVEELCDVKLQIYV